MKKDSGFLYEDLITSFLEKKFIISVVYYDDHWHNFNFEHFEKTFEKENTMV